MKNLVIASPVLVILAGITLVTPALAVIKIDYVSVGNAGNAADPATGSLYGAVSYAYQIAKNETTTSQYVEFLNAVAKTDTYWLYNVSMTSSYINGISQSGVSGNFTYLVNPGSENKPITYVSWFDAARFCNWLQNGQQTGVGAALTAETGAYTLNGATGGIITRNATATVWIPSEDEWYKAAYYDPNKGGAGAGGYWPYPTQSNTMIANDIGVAGAANYYDANGFATYTGGTSWGITDVGAYGTNSDSAYGTNDQAGNVWEWNDAFISGWLRGLRGGAWYNGDDSLTSSSRSFYDPWLEDSYLVGFRVASVPEPSPAGADFRITSVSVMAGGSQLHLTWMSEPSATYAIEDSSDLTTSSWTEVATGILSQGSITTRTLDITPGPRRFFRVAKRP